MQALEEPLARELARLGGENISTFNRAVSCTGDLELLYRINLYSQCALRVLIPLKSFDLQGPDDLYSTGKTIHWEDWFDLHQTFAIYASGSHPRIQHTGFAALKLKDAIADRYRQKTGRRPDVDTDDPDIRIELQISQKKGRILIDSSGDSLHQRVYKKRTGTAPINEVLAAGLLDLMDWSPDQGLMVPMCGSGTFGIEAAFRASGRSPQTCRSHFSLRNWKNFSQKMWRSLREGNSPNPEPEIPPIQCSDSDRKMVQATRMNTRRAGLDDWLSVQKNDFFDLKPTAKNGCIILNPPYDERMEQEDIDSLYKSMSDKLKQDFPAWRAGIISANTDALKAFALKPEKSWDVYNGKLPCVFQTYELYEGSKED